MCKIYLNSKISLRRSSRDQLKKDILSVENNKKKKKSIDKNCMGNFEKKKKNI